MRRVGQEEFQRFVEATEIVSNVSSDSHRDAVNAGDRYRELMESGNVVEAAQFEATTIAELLARKNQILARFEEAAVAFLGELRQPNETGDAYVARISELDLDLKQVLEIQLRNGVVFWP